VLTLYSLGIEYEKLLRFEFMDPPPADAIKKAMELLYNLGAAKVIVAANDPVRGLIV
jgi:HrpA-like RNA helicase